MVLSISDICIIAFFIALTLIGFFKLVMRYIDYLADDLDYKERMENKKSKGEQNG